MATTTRTTRPPETHRPEPATDIPPLENGDRLTRIEFERRYDAMPNLKKAELLDGVVFMPSPVSFRRHSSPHFRLIGWLDSYPSASPGVEGGDNGSIRLDMDNMPQPDAFLIVLPEFGGQVRISDDDYVEGAPELVAEVSSSSASIDLNKKLEIYRRHGVREYIVWRVREQAIDWFALREGKFEPLIPTAEGHYHSEVFPGLWLDPAALIRGDRTAVAQVVQRGLATPEHAAFVARLQEEAARRAPKPT